MTSKLNIIAAADLNNAIGFNGELLYHISDDLERFKRLTLNNIVIMGRKTFESLPNGVLPNRLNIIVSSNRDYKVPGGEVCSDMLEALLYAKSIGEDVFVIGGGSIYKQAILCLRPGDKIYLTRILTQAPSADTYFPKIDYSQYSLDRGLGKTDLSSGLRYIFNTYTKL